MMTIMSFTFHINDICNIENYENINSAYSFSISGVANITEPKNNSLMFVKKLTNDIETALRNVKESIILVQKDTIINCREIEKNNLVLHVNNPRREYAVLLDYMLKHNPLAMKYKTLENCIVIGENTVIGNDTIIEPNVFIDNDVKIGDNCIIMSGVKIKGNVIIGDNTVIRENAVIGGQGYGIERDEDGFTIRIPHLGGVIIGDNVEVGALTAIAAGTIEPTIIEEYVKIDNLVHIAHNVKIGKGSMIIACAEISGSVEIGENVWVAPNACVINKVKIGSNSTIGMGAVVIKNVPEKATVTGNPAETLENIKAFNKIKKQLLSEQN